MILLRERVLVVVTPQALFIVGVDPELQQTGRRVDVVFGQVGAVNLRNHAQRFTLLIGRRRLTCGQVRAATKLGSGLRQRRVGEGYLQADCLLAGATLVECVNDAACLHQGLFGGLVLRHCVLVSSVNQSVCKVSVCQARATVPLRLLPPLDPISGGRAPILVTSASGGQKRWCRACRKPRLLTLMRGHER